MELTKEQLLQIHNYIYVCGIEYYDVRTEVVDHFANILEQKLDENPALDFKNEIQNIHKNFSNNGFKKLLKEKKKSVSKFFYKQSLKQLITFFKLPKIIITCFLFFTLTYIQTLFLETQNFFKLLFFISFLLMFVVFLKAKRRNNKEKFLFLEMGMNFYQVYHIFAICLQLSYSRSLESLSNIAHNYIFIGCYTLLFLFFWSGEHVYRLNKKEVEKQYPNIFV